VVNGAAAAGYTDVLELDLSTVEPSLARPKRPQDRVPLKNAKTIYRKSLVTMAEERTKRNPGATGTAPAHHGGKSVALKDAAVLIARDHQLRRDTSNPYM